MARRRCRVRLANMGGVLVDTWPHITERDEQAIEDAGLARLQREHVPGASRHDSQPRLRHADVGFQHRPTGRADHRSLPFPVADEGPPPRHPTISPVKSSLSPPCPIVPRISGTPSGIASIPVYDQLC